MPGAITAVLLLAVVGCNAPVRIDLFSAPTATPTLPAVPTAVPPTPEAPLGTEGNPLVLAIPPTTRPEPAALSAADTLTALMRKQTGYEFVSIIPTDEAALIDAFGAGDVHVGVVSPFGYLLASEGGDAEAAFAREQDGAIFYGAEFIAPAEPDYLTYYDAVQETNLAEANVALAQFADKKPCWTDEHSPSGYVVPRGILNGAGITTREPAFLTSHPAVVRALYAGGICDFGATYVDAILYPGLEDELPDLTDRLTVIWRVPEIIPYEVLIYSRDLPLEMRRLLTRTFVDLMAMPEGRSAMQTLYGFAAMQIVNDGQYEPFRAAVEDSGLELRTLLDE